MRANLRALVSVAVLSAALLGSTESHASDACSLFVRAGFVPAGGPGAADGTSPATAYSHIRDAASAVINPGTVVCVGPGQYIEGSITVALSGTQAAPIEFRADATGESTGDAPGPIELIPPIGLPPANTPLTGFLLSGQNIVISGFSIAYFFAAGIQVESAVPPVQGNSSTIIIQNNILFGNLAGVKARNAQNVMVANNLVYGNATDGISLGDSTGPAPNSTVLNNTIYGNNGWGIVIAGASPNGLVLDNIVSQNTNGAVAVDLSATCGYIAGFNLVDGSAPYAPSTPANSRYDVVVGDPGFVNPAGADGVLGWQIENGVLVDHSADDDFHLLSGSTPSRGIDGGYTTAAALGLQGTSIAGAKSDTGPVDLGFHYGAGVDQRIVSPLPKAFMPVYVRAAGDDSNDGKSPGKALASLTFGAQIAKAGMTLIVGPGTYAAANIGAPYGGIVMFHGDPDGSETGDTRGPVLVDPSLLPVGSSTDTGFLLQQSCGVTVEGFQVRFAADAGIQVREGSDGALIRNNAVFTSSRGIDVRDANNVSLLNNLVYDNDTGGIEIGGEKQAAHTRVQNNTCYGNVGGNGLTIGTGTANTPGTLVQYNIFAHNGLNGLNANVAYAGGYNLLTDNGYSDYGGVATRQNGDLIDIDPLFVNPAGPDGELGGAGFGDDAFELKQKTAGDAVTSPAVDAGPVTAAQAGVSTGSTRSDGAPDTNAVDLGYHYPMQVAVDLYVDPTGDDANGGRVPGLPMRTIGAALLNATVGSRIHVAAGSYQESNLHPGTGVSILGAGPGRSVISAAGATTAFDVRQPDVVLMHLDVTNAAQVGIRVRADRVSVVDCWIYGNTSHGMAVVSGSNAFVFDNLIYRNGGTGIVGGSNSAEVNAVTVAHNTIYANGGYGVTVGLGTTDPANNTAVVNNVIAANHSNGVGVGADSAASLEEGHNCNRDGYRGIVPPATDIGGDPELIAPSDTSGSDFRLAQSGAGQSPASPCVDAGFRTVAQAQLVDTSTRTDNVPDSGQVDIGYHYGLTSFDRKAARFFRFGIPNGDCDGDGFTRVNELILAVNIALGEMPLDACVTLDGNGDGRISIDEVVAAVNQALRD